MPFRLYMDQDSSDSALVRALRDAAIDVLTTHEAGHQRASDSEQLAFVASEGRALYTANQRDFARLHKLWMTEGRHHAGVIIRSRQRLSVGEQFVALRDICTAFGTGGSPDAFIYLSSWLRA